MCTAAYWEETNHAGIFELEPMGSWVHINDAHSGVLAFYFTVMMSDSDQSCKCSVGK